MYTKYFTVTIHHTIPQPVTQPRHRIKSRTDTVNAILVALTAIILFAAILTASYPYRETQPITPAESYTPVSVTSTYEKPVLPIRYKTPAENVSYDETSENAIYDARLLYDVPAAETGFKAYMDYRAITSTSSTQWKMQQEAWTDENGFRRYGDYYMVAMGTYYSPVCGAAFHIVMESGAEYDVIMGDVKSDRHTDKLHQHINGNVIEFIVDSKTIPSKCRYHGDMSYANSMFEGRIAEIYLIPETEA